MRLRNGRWHHRGEGGKRNQGGPSPRRQCLRRVDPCFAYNPPGRRLARLGSIPGNGTRRRPSGAWSRSTLSLAVLGLAAAIQLLIFIAAAASRCSPTLIHNFGDAATAISGARSAATTTCIRCQQSVSGAEPANTHAIGGPARSPEAPDVQPNYRNSTRHWSSSGATGFAPSGAGGLRLPIESVAAEFSFAPAGVTGFSRRRKALVAGPVSRPPAPRLQPPSASTDCG